MTSPPTDPLSPATRTSIFNRILNGIERVGNALPHPASIFALLAVLVVVASWLAHLSGASAIHPTTLELIRPVNLLGSEGLVYMYVNFEENFIAFPPFGIVLVSVIGLGIAEGTGLIEALIKQSILKAPKRLVTSFIIAAGILSHLASSVGYIVLIPLGGLVFMAFKRHPIAGIAAAFAGVSGGFGANFLIGSIDPILSGLSESAAGIVTPGMRVNPAANYYFMIASAFMLTIVGTFVTEKIVEPRLGPYKADFEEIQPLSPLERRGLWFALGTLLLIIAAFLLLTIPQGSLLRGSGNVLEGPFFKGLITGILLFFALPGFVYGVVTGKIRSDSDMITLMTKAIKDIAPYVILVFFASQFIAWFQKSNLGLLLAIHGAEAIQSSGISGLALIFLFILFSAIMNFFMGSASAKWAIMAPVFVPMFMLSGYHPALTQAAFRIGDSVTNIITPMMSYYALILTFVNKYDKKAGLGTTIATMLPYTIFFFIFWSLLLGIWYFFRIPLGPGAPIMM